MLFKRLGMYLFYTSQETSVIDVFSCQPFDSLKDGTKSIAEGDKLRKSCQAIKLLCLKKRNYQSLACFWILIEFNGILGLEKVGERKRKEKIYIKEKQKERAKLFYADGLTHHSAMQKSNRCLIHSSEYLMYRYFIQPNFSMDHSHFFSEKPTFLWSLALTILLSIPDSIIKPDAFTFSVWGTGSPHIYTSCDSCKSDFTYSWFICRKEAKPITVQLLWTLLFNNGRYEIFLSSFLVFSTLTKTITMSKFDNIYM